MRGTRSLRARRHGAVAAIALSVANCRLLRFGRRAKGRLAESGGSEG